jgi:hypothetical protein
MNDPFKFTKGQPDGRILSKLMECEEQVQFNPIWLEKLPSQFTLSDAVIAHQKTGEMVSARALVEELLGLCIEGRLKQIERPGEELQYVKVASE